MEDDDFQWDDLKADANLRKHGIRFRLAIKVFADPFVHIEMDDSEDYGEDRYLATGIVGDRLITTIFTERGDRRRIISARKANANEQREYHRS